MNILILLKTLRGDGGVETMVAALGNGLHAQGHTVYVAAFCDDGENDLLHRSDLSENCFVYLGQIGGLLSQLNQIRRLRRILSEKNIDIVHTHLYHPGLVGRLAAEFHKSRTLATEHSTFYHWWRLTHYLIDRWLARRTGALTAVSPSAAGTLAARTGIYPDQIKVLPNMIDMNRFQPVGSEIRDPKRILMAGRLEYPKNHGYALHILHELRKHDQSYHMVVFGRGSREAEIRTMIKTLDLADAVELLPPTKDFASELRRSGMLLLPSIWEGFPAVLLEAHATLTPVVATRAPGIIDVVQDRQTGRLIPLGNAREAASIVLDALNNKEESEKLTAQAFANLDRFQTDQVVQDYISVYSSLMSNA